jgi:hypothetical protein
MIDGRSGAIDQTRWRHGEFATIHVSFGFTGDFGLRGEIANASIKPVGSETVEVTNVTNPQ